MGRRAVVITADNDGVRGVDQIRTCTDLIVIAESRVSSPIPSRALAIAT
jgi:hypothetical protein